MSHWFHRNPLKATQPLKFEALKKASKAKEANELLTYVRKAFYLINTGVILLIEI